MAQTLTSLKKMQGALKRWAIIKICSQKLTLTPQNLKLKHLNLTLNINSKIMSNHILIYIIFYSYIMDRLSKESSPLWMAFMDG